MIGAASRCGRTVLHAEVAARLDRGAAVVACDVRAASGGDTRSSRLGRVGRSVGAVEPNTAWANTALEDVWREASSEASLGADRCPACVGPWVGRLGLSRRRVAALIHELRGGLAID